MSELEELYSEVHDLFAKDDCIESVRVQEYLDKVSKMKALVNQLGLISKNEEIEDMATSSIKVCTCSILA